MKTLLAALAASLVISAQAQDPIRVYAAGSLRSPLNEIAASYSGVKIEVVYGASGLLRDRIANGERPHVFASANMQHPHSLALAGLAGRVYPDRVLRLRGHRERCGEGRQKSLHGATC